MKITNVCVATDLYNAGMTEDGRAYEAEKYFVVVEFADGSRKAHEASFKGCVAAFCDEGEPYFTDVRAEAMAAAERLRARVEAALAEGKTLNPLHWYDLQPAYGSPAYQVLLDELSVLPRAERERILEGRND